jgi:hypothetical protein
MKPYGYCEDCYYFRRILQTLNHGECMDPSKLIFDESGTRRTEPPYVHRHYYCWSMRSADSMVLRVSQPVSQHS